MKQLTSFIVVLCYCAIYNCSYGKGAIFNELISIARDTLLPTDVMLRPTLLLVTGGRFQMGGSKNGVYDEYPAHWVTVDNFRISKYETTVGQFRQFIRATGYRTDAEKAGYCYVDRDGSLERLMGVTWECGTDGKRRTTKEDNQPVIFIGWNDAKAYCRWLSLETCMDYDLPSEAQWEYAASGGKGQEGYMYSGSNNFDSVAWCLNNCGGTTHEVGMKDANSLGIFDMSGNVFEWCNDWYDDQYYKLPERVNPTGPDTGSFRVLRGGGWCYDASFCRVASRNYSRPENCFLDYGFRVVVNR